MAEPVAGALDPTRSLFISIFGRKGSGKSLLARRLWATWPYDRLVVDPTGDVDPGPDTEKLTQPLPSRWPERIDGERSSYRFVPDPGSHTYEEDLDRAVGLAFYHRRTLLWLDEVGEHTRAAKTYPHMRRALHQGRHRQLSMLMCGPRPIDVNPLVISQADLVYIFELPNPKDRERIANYIGWDPGEIDRAVQGLPKHGYLRYDANAEDPELELLEFPPIPLAKAR